MLHFGSVLKIFFSFVILFLLVNLFAKPVAIKPMYAAVACPYTCQATAVCTTANGMVPLTRFSCGTGTVCCRPAVVTSNTYCTKGTKGPVNTCKGIYKYYLANTTKPAKNNPTGLNFGDYDCDLLSFVDSKYVRNKTKVYNKIYAYLKDLGKTAHYNIWKCIANAEASSNALAYNKYTTNGSGWGMYQMDPLACKTLSSDPFRYYKTGNVVWERQIKDAIYYNYKYIGGSFKYWSTRCQCGVRC